MKQKEIDRVIDFVQNDTRSKDEIFESLKQRILNDANGQLSYEEVTKATHNLLRYFELFDQQYDKKKAKKLLED